MLFHIKKAFLVFCLAAPAAAQDLVVTIGGDVNFTRHGQKPSPHGVNRHSLLPFSSQTEGIEAIIKSADVNFANIETVITDREDLTPEAKSFTFQGHPKALQHLIQIGFNLFSLANNHSHDYGREGIEETLKHTRTLETQSNVAFHGLGWNREEAATPRVLEVKGVRIAMVAFGITGAGFFAGPQQSGVLGYFDESHLRLALKKLREAPVDLRFVSIHFGRENQVTLDPGQKERFHRILHEGQVDLIIGHHPHVVRPVENIGGKLIFYSLGNYFMTGSADMTKKPTAMDHGLMAKIYFSKNSESGLYEIQEVQAIPLTNTHSSPRPLNSEASLLRLSQLNELSRQQLGSSGVQFNFDPQLGLGRWLRTVLP